MGTSYIVLQAEHSGRAAAEANNLANFVREVEHGTVVPEVDLIVNAKESMQSFRVIHGKNNYAHDVLTVVFDNQVPTFNIANAFRDHFSMWRRGVAPLIFDFAMSGSWLNGEVTVSTSEMLCAVKLLDQLRLAFSVVNVEKMDISRLSCSEYRLLVHGNFQRGWLKTEFFEVVTPDKEWT